MNRTISVMKMHWRDKWVWIYVPWFILLLSFAVNLIIGISMGGEENINTGGVSSIFIYMFVCSMVIQGQTFPFALGMNVRRTDFFMGTSVMGLLVSAASAVILFFLSVVEKLTDDWGGAFALFHHSVYEPYFPARTSRHLFYRDGEHVFSGIRHFEYISPV